MPARSIPAATRRRLERFVLPVSGVTVLFAVLVGGALAYAAVGGSAREALVSQMLVNAIIVVGLQIYIGNTGILSFGHMGFAAIAGYVVALLAIEPLFKQIMIPEAPWGIADVHLDPLPATAVAVVVTLAVAFVVGLGLVRSGSRAGAVAPTMITLALLFLVREAASNFAQLTAGNRAGLSFGPGNSLEGRTWIFVALAGALLIARLFKELPVGRLAQAARDDDLAARASGIAPAVPQMIALLVSVAIVAVGASLRVQLLGSMTPNFFFFTYTLLTLTMLIVGGRSSVTGAVLGVVVITAGNELTRYVAGGGIEVPGLGWLFREGLSDLFLGAAMLGFMIFRPEGLVGDRELDQLAAQRLPPAPEPPPARVPEPRGATTLVVDDLNVDFGGYRAVGGAEFEVHTGEVVGLIGPNGAGKTTLLNAITGLVPVAFGTIALDDEPIVGRSTHRIARAGVSRTFQNLRLFGSRTVRENVAVAALVAAQHRAGHPRPDVDGLIEAVGLWHLRDRRAGEIDHGAARRLELARAVALAPAFVLLDEPTSGMGEAESVAMVDRVRRTAAEVGAGVLVIDHDLRFITTICDRIYVLDQGAVIAHGTPDEIRDDPRVREAYLGTSADAPRSRNEGSGGGGGAGEPGA